MSARAKREIATRDEAGIKAANNFRVNVVESGGHDKVPFISKDVRNYVDKVRRLRLGEGDANAVRTYFEKMQEMNKDFYYSMDIDNKGRLEHVFWADARSRLTYKEFNEVISFDTTYLVNRYDMPFAPFVGVNHHGQSILLGCGIVSNETTETFTWLFKKWLACMGGIAPQGIITDQDRAMQNAIAEVFPNTTHRWCLWHILKKCNEKLNGYQNPSIVVDMHGAVYDSQRPADFECSWNEMVVKYGLQQNKWLSGLYEERQRWVPCYVKHTFWAGMFTTQRSEGMNPFFDGYVNPKTSLKAFVEQYDSALMSKIEKETQEDSRSFYKMIPLTTQFRIEKQMQSLYTISKFKEFQDQLNGQIYCRTIAIQKDGTFWVYTILELNEWRASERQQQFVVLYNHSDCEFECSCHLFEYIGIVSRHAIFVLLENRVVSLPGRYILRRWRKDVKRPHMRVTITDKGWVVTSEYKRYNELCILFTRVADMASNDEIDYEELKQWLISQEEKLTKQRSHCGIDEPFDARKLIDDVEVPSNGKSVQNPAKSIRKGRVRGGRFVGEGEKHSAKAKKKHKAAAKEKQGDSAQKTKGKEQSNCYKRTKTNDALTADSVLEVPTTQDCMYFLQGPETTYMNQPYCVNSFMNQTESLVPESQSSTATPFVDVGAVWGAPMCTEDGLRLRL